MRSLSLALLLLSLGPLSGCSATVTTGAGGHSGSGVTTSGGTTSTSGGTTSTSGVTETCIPNGETCLTGIPCCGWGECNGGFCALCYTLYDQCMCDGVPVGPPNGCTAGEACGLDAGLPDGGGACACMEVSQQMTCD